MVLFSGLLLLVLGCGLCVVAGCWCVVCVSVV